MAKYAINEGFLQRIERLQTILKNNTAGMFGGNHGSKTFGASCEFADYRDYKPGDDITKIDWNAYARTEKLYLKLYLDERRLHTKIYIDASRSMDFGEGKKAETALQIAAALAYLAVCEFDKVSIFTIKGSVVEEIISGVSGRENFYAEIGKLNDIVFEGDCFISNGILPTKVGYGDGMSVIISDFLTDNDYETAIDYLVDKKRDLLCVQVLTSEELNPQVRGKNQFTDSERPNRIYKKNIDREIIEAYKAAVNYVKERMRNYCSARGAAYLLASDNKPIDSFLFEQLTSAGVLK